MDFLRRNRIRLGCVISTAIMLAGIAFLWSVLLGPGKWRTATPHMVDVIVMMGKSRRKLEIRDPSAIVVLQSLITGGRTIDARPPSRPEFEIFVHPPGKRSYAYSPSPVWRTADGFAWQHDGRVTALDGSLTDFIEWLKIRRINQLLEALDPQQRQLGEQLRDALRQQHVESLIRIANSPNGWFAQSGIREIAEFISVEPARLNLYIPGEMQWPGRRAVADPNRRIRDELLRLVTICPRAEHAKDPFGAGVMALECLQQVGDRKTADALMKLPERHRGGWLEDRLLTTIERLYGIPATYERFFICGNSSAEELAESAKELSRRQAAAMDDLMAWQKEIAGDSDEQFYDAVVLRWSEMLIHIAKTPDRSGYLNDPTPAPQLTNLLGLGVPVVPALQRRKEAATDWHEVAMLEFCIGFLTGQCDADLVTQLLAGDLSQQRLACSIIAATADRTWDDPLAALLRTPLADQHVDEVIVLRDVAALALYRTSGSEAVAAFHCALEEGFESGMMIRILDRLEIPVSPY